MRAGITTREGAATELLEACEACELAITRLLLFDPPDASDLAKAAEARNAASAAILKAEGGDAVIERLAEIAKGGGE